MYPLSLWLQRKFASSVSSLTISCFIPVRSMNADSTARMAQLSLDLNPGSPSPNIKYLSLDHANTQPTNPRTTLFCFTALPPHTSEWSSAWARVGSHIFFHLTYCTRRVGHNKTVYEYSHRFKCSLCILEVKLALPENKRHRENLSLPPFLAPFFA